MWSKKMFCWTDYNLKTISLKEESFYISRFSPIIHDIKPPKPFKAKEIIKKYISLQSHRDFGIPYSFQYSAQQWDFSNVWAPNQHEIIFMLLKHNRELSLS